MLPDNKEIDWFCLTEMRERKTNMFESRRLQELHNNAAMLLGSLETAKYPGGGLRCGSYNLGWL